MACSDGEAAVVTGRRRLWVEGRLRVCERQLEAMPPAYRRRHPDRVLRVRARIRRLRAELST